MKIQLEEKGFNIFFTTPVKDLPSSLIDSFNEDEKNKYLLMIGSGGKNLWDKLPNKNSEHPFDSYSIDTMKALELENTKIIFPDNNRLLPLQALGRHFNFSMQSPIGLDISEQYGLWFAYRGILLTDTPLAMNAKKPGVFPCESCLLKPCLSVSDLSQARLLCPYKSEFQYSQEQLDYHQKVLRMLKVY